jgi:hypothetical protein
MVNCAVRGTIVHVGVEFARKIRNTHTTEAQNVNQYCKPLRARVGKDWI